MRGRDLGATVLALSLALGAMADPAEAAAGDRPASPAGQEKTDPKDETRVQAPPRAALRLPVKKYGRAALETGAFLLGSTTHYWLNPSQWIQDELYRATWEDQSRRFFTFEAWRFDTNAFSVNWTHALAGSLYYSFARSNNLNFAEAGLYTLAGSMYLEYVAEWRDVVAINDSLTTVIGGLSIGEAWHRIGTYLAGRPGVLGRVLTALNPILGFNRALDRKERLDWLPEPPAARADFRLESGGRGVRSPAGSRLDARASVFAEVVDIPDYGRAGSSASGFVAGTAWSLLSFESAGGAGGVEETEFRARAVPYGYFRQSIGPDGRGWNAYAGISTAFSIFRKKGVAYYDSHKIKFGAVEDLGLETPRDFRDKMAVVHMFGPLVDLSAFGRGLRLRLTLEAYLDFGLINAFALNPYSAGHDIRGAKTTLLYYGYYYAVGTTEAAEGLAELPWIEIRAGLRRQAYASIQGLDQCQDTLADDFGLRDRRTAASLRLGLTPPGWKVGLFACWESIVRRGEIREVLRRETERRFSWGAAIRF